MYSTTQFQKLLVFNTRYDFYMLRTKTRASNYKVLFQYQSLKDVLHNLFIFFLTHFN